MGPAAGQWDGWVLWALALNLLWCHKEVGHQEEHVFSLCRLHEVSHVPQPIPQLLDLGHRNPFEFGDNRNLGVHILYLVAFVGEEGPPCHVDHDPKLQQPLQDSHPPVPGHHILLSLVIQKPPGGQGP